MTSCNTEWVSSHKYDGGTMTEHHSLNIKRLEMDRKILICVVSCGVSKNEFSFWCTTIPFLLNEPVYLYHRYQNNDKSILMRALQTNTLYLKRWRRCITIKGHVSVRVVAPQRTKG
mmetsp:Transcript_35616/g.85940  ORF Transcript_35616/g.85940 Transcript_35616/m.85940 type:complete len:116 (-) Transcript_35616:982-1329(-)